MKSDTLESMNTRQAKLLTAIIDEFIKTGIPVGSKQIIDHGFFLLSGATIRNEMRALGEEGFIEQPHTSAGRIPTAKGYQLYVREYMEPNVHELQVRSRFDVLKQQYLERKDQERVYEAVALLSQMIPNVAFATVPHKERVYYMGLANTLRQPEFHSNPDLATGVVEVLENRLTELLDGQEIDDDVRYFIGDEHLLPQIQSCSVLVTQYSVRGEAGAIGILGPMRMDYAYNTVVLDLVSDLLRSN
jgi:transcriptional regulator of heat shock response